MSSGVFIGVIVVVIMWWIYSMQYANVYYEKVFLDDVKHLFKTGDLILFKASDNFNSIFHGSYFGHVGIIYMNGDIPMLFEANGIEYMPLRPHHSKSGIFITPVASRISKYKGRCFWKQLAYPVDQEIIKGFEEFITYALENFKYDKHLFQSGFKKCLGVQKCNKETDCGSIVFLSLIKLGLIPVEEYDKNIWHHLIHVNNLTNLQNNYFKTPLEVIDHPFAY